MHPLSLTKTLSGTTSLHGSLCPLFSPTHLCRLKSIYLFLLLNNITKTWFPKKKVSFFLRGKRRKDILSFDILSLLSKVSYFDLKLAWILSTTYNPSFSIQLLLAGPTESNYRKDWKQLTQDFEYLSDARGHRTFQATTTKP